MILGFGMSGSGPSAAQAFTSLKDRGVRKTTVDQEVAAAEAAMAAMPEGTALIMTPPAIDPLDTTSGFSLRLEDRANAGPAALKAAEEQLIALASASPRLTGVMSEGLPDGLRIKLQIDREKAQALGLGFARISEMRATGMPRALASSSPKVKASSERAISRQIATPTSTTRVRSWKSGQRTPPKLPRSQNIKSRACCALPEVVTM